MVLLQTSSNDIIVFNHCFGHLSVLLWWIMSILTNPKYCGLFHSIYFKSSQFDSSISRLPFLFFTISCMAMLHSWSYGFLLKLLIKKGCNIIIAFLLVSLKKGNCALENIQIDLLVWNFFIRIVKDLDWYNIPSTSDKLVAHGKYVISNTYIILYE